MKSIAQTLVQSDKLKMSYTSPIYSKRSCALRQYFGFIAELRLGRLASGVPWVRFLGKSIRARNFGYNVTFVCVSARPPAQNGEFKQRRRVQLRQRHKARILSVEKGKMLVLHVQHEFFRAFLCRTPQNNNVKSPNFRF